MTLRNAFADLATEQTQTGMDAALTEIAILLGQLVSRTGYQDATTGGQRVMVANSPSISTVTPVTTVTNQTQAAGISLAYDQYAAMLSMAAHLRNRITVA